MNPERDRFKSPQEPESRPERKLNLFSMSRGRHRIRGLRIGGRSKTSGRDLLSSLLRGY